MMRWIVIGCCLASLLALSSTKSVTERNVEPGECTQANKQKAVYGHPKYSPTFSDSPVTLAYTTVKGVVVEPLREYGAHGIYQATMMHTRQKNGDGGCGGYFGVQWNNHEHDQMLFSIWDQKSKGQVTSYALPMHDATCKRNANDAHGESNGSQCKFLIPQKLQEGDELILTVEREAVETAEYKDVTYNGHVWKVTVQLVEGEVITLGRILFTEDDLDIGEQSPGGITGMSMFHEHIGCTPCGSFAFEVQRTGPYVTGTAGDRALPVLQEMYGSWNCPWSTLGISTCRAFDVKSDEFGSINFLTGAEGLFPHWDVENEKDVKIY